MPASEGYVLFRRTSVPAPKGPVRAAARLLLDRVSGGREFGCLITGDRELRRLNRQFRGNPKATDVLSFPSDAGNGFLGEMAISIHRASEQAARYGHSLSDEIAVLMLHGLLHLQGFDHERDRGRMARAEAAWRKRLGLPAGLIERVRAV